MKKYLAILLFLLLKSFFLEAQGFAVVELFTSEGCSSCPPAEKVLSNIMSDAEKNHKNIFCLEYHVDYWNHGGWKDQFSRSQFTKRQDDYLGVLKQPELYTPQMIVNGETEFVGSHAEQANTVIDKALKENYKITLTTEVDSVIRDSVFISFSSSEINKNFSLHLAIVENNIVSKVGKGENSGMTLTHNSVVRIFYSRAVNEKKGSVVIPLKGTKLNPNCHLISFVQHKQTMKILSVAQKNFTSLLQKD